jgi:hypothetical protein
MARKCVFCGGEPVTLEHVWPAWARALYGNASSFDYELTRRGEPTRKWAAVGMDVEVKATCEGCNSGWMAALEGRSKDVLTPMADGRYRILHANDQKLLALWALKTALMFKCVDRSSEGFNPAHYESLYEHLPGLPPRAYVLLGRFDPSDQRDFYRSRDVYDATTGVQGKAPLHIAAFTLRQMVFLVAVSGDPTRGLEIESEYIRPLAPSRGTIEWPTKPVIDEPLFLGLIDVFPEA